MQQVCIAASIALSFAVYGHVLATRPGLEAVSAMLWLQITSTGEAALLAAVLLRGRLLQCRKDEA